MKRVELISDLNIVLESFEDNKYSTNSYFFGDELNRLINSKSLFFDSFGNNILIYKHIKDLDFFEVYYYIKDTSSPIKMVDDEAFVMEIPYQSGKNYPSAIVEFWNNSDFVTHINRDLLGLVRPDTSGFSLPNAEFEYTFIENSNLVDLICESIKNAFDKFTGDILSVSEVASAIQNKEIVGAFKDGELAGFIRFYSKNKVSWIGHLVVLPKYKGKRVGKSLVTHYLKIRSDQGFTNFQQWVQSNNEAALKLYSNFGFKSTNKSSISLLKIKKMEKFYGILEEIRPDIDFKKETQLVDDGLLDSFDIVSIVSELNDYFDIAIRVSELNPENFNSAEAIYKMCIKLKENK
jgi:acyl carrier protein/ribosomal protein S18 acetylase RimI-like enzyme